MISAIESSWYSDKMRQVSSATVSSKYKEAEVSSNRSQDTVTISDEAKALFAKIANKGGTKPGGEPAVYKDSAAATGDQAAEASGKTAAGVSTGSMGSVEDIRTEAEQLEDVDGRIKELQDQIQTIMGSNRSPQEKMQQAEPLQAQISQLTQQKAKLEADVIKSKVK